MDPDRGGDRTRRGRRPGLLLAAGWLLAAPCLWGCSPRAYVLRETADALSSGGGTFASDDDPELVRDAVPAGLKTMESLLEEVPGHRGLLEALCRGFTQYAVAFVAQDAAESADPESAAAGRARAVRLFRRAKEYGLRGLAAGRPGFRDALAADPVAALSGAGGGDVPLLFWTAASWSLAVAGSPGDPAALADLPAIEALGRRALALDETYDGGAIHEYFIAFEGARPEAMGGSADRARRHFDRAMELSGGGRISPLVTLAETVSVRTQDRNEYLALLDRALAFDARGGPARFRLANLIAQRKARWLKGRVDALFLE